MKKKAVFTIVACSIAALLLTGVLAVGLYSDGFGLFFLFDRETDSPEIGKNQYDYTWDPAESEVSGLDVEWSAGPVHLKVSNDKVIRITERCGKRLEEKDRLVLSSSGNVLEIRWSEKNFFLFNFFQNYEKELEVEVPKEVAENLELLECSNVSGTLSASGFAAESMEFSSTSGNLELSDLKGEEGECSTTSGDITLEEASLSEKLDVNTTSGIMRFSNVQAEETDISTVSGDLEYNGTAKSFSASSVSAELEANLGNCPEEVDMEAVSGELILEIPENDGFEVDFSSISGNLSSDFPLSGDTGKSGRALYSSGKAKFSFSTTSGNMRILKS